MNLRETIKVAHLALKENNIDHALIGGVALATLGLNRATADVDLLIDGDFKDLAKKILIQKGFILKTETEDVLHFEGFGYLDLLLAKRPLSKKMLSSASVKSLMDIKCLQAEDIIGLKIQAYKNDKKRELRDKADILSLFEINKSLDMNKIKMYADIFNEWEAIKKLLEL